MIKFLKLVGAHKCRKFELGNTATCRMLSLEN